MSGIILENRLQVSTVWIRWQPRDKNDEQTETLREIPVPTAAESTIIRQIIRMVPSHSCVVFHIRLFSAARKVLTKSFGLDSDGVVLKIRNRHGRLIPLSSCMGPSSEHTPLVLEATRPFQHVCPKPRTGSTTVITKRMKTRLQAANHRIQRLEELLPEIKLQQNDKRVQEMEGLKQKLKVLGQRMQVAGSHRWRGVLDKAPLW
ncbi:uncharacterized protein LOC144992265 isoform X3 [Oryzias latipes]